MTDFYHTPVLLEEVVRELQVEKERWYIDCTLGGGGYSFEILKRGGKIVGIDKDYDALEYTKKRFQSEFPEKEEGRDWSIVHGDFRELAMITSKLEVQSVRGVVFDLGVSSAQLNRKERGFSYRFPDALLDMRMNNREGIPASSILNTYIKEDLYDIFARFGEEERAGTVADAITVARKVKKFETVSDLVSVLETLPGDTDRIKARIFQALRIEVNQELMSLKAGLVGASKMLEHGGKLIVVSFHSLEDRVVKRFFRSPAWTRVTSCVVPGEVEQRENPRSRSAKLRAGEKL